jgi:hypothetical protein
MYVCGAIRQNIRDSPYGLWGGDCPETGWILSKRTAQLPERLSNIILLNTAVIVFQYHAYIAFIYKLFWVVRDDAKTPRDVLEKSMHASAVASFCDVTALFMQCAVGLK